MASPSTAQQPNGHASPPAAPSTTAPQPHPSTSAVQPAQPPPDAPLTSLDLADDPAASKRPRDARLLHLVLSAQGIQSYQERVPLQLLDFAYRYTSGVLSDALRLAGEGYTGAGAEGGRGRGRGAGGAGGDGEGSIGVTALRQAIASRQDFGFTGAALPKEFMLEQAAERNRVALPRVERAAGGGLALPEEKYCLTGQAWGLKESWEESEDDEPEVPGRGQEVRMGGMDEAADGGDEEDEEGAGRMEDVFGEEGGEGGDVDMGGN